MGRVTNMAVTQHHYWGRGVSVLSQWSIWHWRWRHVTLKCWCPLTKTVQLVVKVIVKYYCDTHQWQRLTWSEWPNRMSPPLCTQGWASQKCSDGDGGSSTHLSVIMQQYIVVEIHMTLYSILCQRRVVSTVTSCSLFVCTALYKIVCMSVQVNTKRPLAVTIRTFCALVSELNHMFSYSKGL